MRNHKLGMGLALATSFALLHTGTAHSAVQVWDFDSSTQSLSSNRNGNSLLLTSSDGVNLRITGWSDSFDLAGDDTVRNARLTWADSTGLGVRNRDERNNATSRTIDSITTDVDGEYDMVLLEFDTEVTLDGIDLNAALGGAVANTTDISILAWNGTGSSSVNLSTWEDVLESNGGAYQRAGNYSTVGLSYYTVNPARTASSAWLIGVYNPEFGTATSGGDDSFILGGFQTSTIVGPPVVTVSSPGTLSLALLGLFGARSRARSRSRT